MWSQSAFLWLVIGALLSQPVFAGFMKVWRLEELAKAPVLAVCRVERVVPGRDVAPGQLPWRTASREMTAELTILRSLPSLETRTLTLHYYGYGNVQGGITNGDAIWPSFQPGAVLVFPLTQKAGKWSLAMEEGMNNTMPARVDPRPEPLPTAKYDFLVGELVNDLCWGDYRTVYAAAEYLLREGWHIVPGTLMPLLRQNIAHDQERWADIAASSIATQGYPRQPMAEIRSADPPRLLATFALQQLPQEKWQEMVVHRMMEHSDVHAWGSAATLQEFAKHPAVLAQMPARLRQPAPGAVYIAWWIVRADPDSPLRPVALTAAVKDLPNTDRDYNQRVAAVELILEFGLDADKNALVETFRHARQANLKLYCELFSAAETKDSLVVLRMAGFMLDDRRVFGSSTMRYCDRAVFAVQRIAKQSFGLRAWDQPVRERDQALVKAADWLRSRGRR